MKKTKLLSLAATIGLMLTACGEPANMAGTTPGNSAERVEIVNSMESQANGPFAIDWNMELKKEC